jgi:hypothetical protein
MGERRKKLPGKNYSLISAQIRLNKYAEEDEIKNAMFDRRLKGFHLFCAIMFGTFILDGFLPFNTLKSHVLGTKNVAFEKKEVTDTVNGKVNTTTVTAVSRIDIITDEGIFVTNDISGYPIAGTDVDILRTPLFKVQSQLYFKEFNYYATRWINFSGNFIFWPLLSFLISFICVISKRYYGSPTLAAIAILNIVPFFTVVYKS